MKFFGTALLLLLGFVFQPAWSQTVDFTYDQDCFELSFQDLSDLTGATNPQYNWDFGDGGSSTATNPAYTYAAEGDYTVVLTITWDEGSGSSTSEIAVHLPVVIFTSSEACFGEPTLFDGTSSTSQNSTIISWEWDFDNDGITDLTGETASWTFPTMTPEQVTLTVTNDLGCVNDDKQNVVIKQPPLADFEAEPVCAGSPTSFVNLSTTPGGGGTIISNSWDFDNDGISDSNEENPVYTFSSGGTYPVTLAIENNQGCTDTITKDILVYDLPEASYTFDPGCPFEPTVFTDESADGDAPVNFWEWDFGDSSPLVNNQNPEHTYLQNGFYNVTLTVQDENGCKDDTTQVVVQQAPEASFVAEVVCFGSPTVFENTSSFEPGYEITNWQWDFGDASGTSADENPSYTYLNHGEYEVELIATNNLLCTDTAYLTVLVDTLPVASFVYDPACEGLPTCFTDASIANADTIASWEWNFGDESNSSQQNPCHAYLSSGTYEVTLTVTNTDGCVSEPYSETIFVSVAPDVAFTNNDACFGDSTFFENLTDTFGYSIAYLEWNFGDTASSNNTSGQFNPFHVFTSPGVFDVKLIVENEYGCIDSVINTITIDSLPTANFTMQDSVSMGVQFLMTDLSVPHGSPIFTWFWDFGDGTTGTNINPITHSYENPGTYVVCLTVTDFNGCAHSHCDTIVVMDKPTADFSYGSDVDLNTIFDDESQPSYSIVDWFWNFGDPATTNDTISGTPQPNWQYSAEGWYSVFLEIEDSYGGVHDTTKLIYAGNAVVPDFEQYGQCVGDTTFFIDHASSPLVSTFETWYWNFGDGTDTTYYEEADTILHHYDFPGIYEVKYAVSATINGFFMTDTLEKVVGVFESPVARIDTAGLNVCFGTTIQFSDNTPAILDPIVDWIWDFDTEEGDSAFIKDPEFLYADTGAYNVKMIVVTEQGCTSIDSAMAHVSIAPEFGFIIENNCVNSPTYFIPDYDSSKITITKWYWNFGDELSSSNTSDLARPSHVYDRVAEFTITMKMEAFGCAGETQQTTLVYPIPYSQFTLEDNYGGVQGRTKFTNNSIYATTYLWDFGNGNTSTVAEPVEVYEYDSSYTITLISYNEYLCSDTSRADLTVFFKGLYFPTAFSPNNPNEEISVFQPKGVNLKDYLVQVFDMRGNLLWESDKLDEEGTPVEHWDGYFDGRLMPQGMYIWKAAGKFRDGSIWQGQSFDAAEPQTNGVVTIVR
jgi:PKD repeat protein